MRFQNPMAMSSRLQLSNPSTPSSPSTSAPPTISSFKKSLLKMKSSKDLSREASGKGGDKDKEKMDLPALPAFGQAQSGAILLGTSSQKERRNKSIASSTTSTATSSPIIPTRLESVPPTPLLTPSPMFSSPSTGFPAPKKSLMFNLKNLSSGNLLSSNKSSNSKPIGLGLAGLKDGPTHPRIVKINDLPISHPTPLPSTAFPVDSSVGGNGLTRTTSIDSFLSDVSSSDEEEFTSYAQEFPSPPALAPIQSAPRPRPQSAIFMNSSSMASTLNFQPATAGLKELQALKEETRQMYNLAQSDVMSMVNLGGVASAGAGVKKTARKAVPQLMTVGSSEEEEVSLNTPCFTPAVTFSPLAESAGSSSGFYKNVRATQSVAVFSSARVPAPQSPSIPYRRESLFRPKEREAFSPFSPSYSLARPTSSASASGSESDSGYNGSLPGLSSSSSSTKSSSIGHDSTPGTPTTESCVSPLTTSSVFGHGGGKPNYFLEVAVVNAQEEEVEEMVYPRRMEVKVEIEKKEKRGFWAKAFKSKKGGKVVA